MNRSRLPSFLLVPAALCFAPAAQAADAAVDPPSRAAAGLPISPAHKDKIDRAVDRALRYLVSKQDAEGWISASAQPKNHAVHTALSLLAMSAAGHETTDLTPEGRALHKGLRYLLRPENQEENGYWGGHDGSRMYGQAIITLACSELLGQTLDEETDQLIRRRVTKAVELILRAQQVRRRGDAQGGWRYLPESFDADLSVTVWQLMALRSARNAGLAVPKKAIDDAAGYIRRCYRAPQDANAEQQKNGFGYMPGGNHVPTPSTTSMGLLSLQLCGEYDSPIVRGATNWLMEHPPAVGNEWQFYGAYYYSQAMFQRGGQYAARGRQVVTDLLLPDQRPDGSWESTRIERWEGPVYTTCMAVLALAVKYHYLPIYQR
jgi:hypothetical protein